MRPALRYEPAIVAASILIAIAASTVALWSVRALRSADQNNMICKHMSTACIMGVAIAGMHYTGMAAADFAGDFAAGSICGAAAGVKPEWLAAAGIPSALAILIVTLLLFHLGARARFLACSAAQLNDRVDHMQGLTRWAIRSIVERSARSDG